MLHIYNACIIHKLLSKVKFKQPPKMASTLNIQKEIYFEKKKRIVDLR